MKNNLPNVIKLREVLFTYALLLTDYNHHLAKELLQATMQQIIKQATAYSPVISFSSWAKEIMERVYCVTVKVNDIQQLRRQCHRGPSHSSILRSEDKYNVREAVYIMSKLSPQQAAVLTLRLQGCSHPQIAHKMNITAHRVKTHILQARHVINHVWDN